MVIINRLDKMACHKKYYYNFSFFKDEIVELILLYLFRVDSLGEETNTDLGMEHRKVVDK